MISKFRSCWLMVCLALALGFQLTADNVTPAATPTPGTGAASTGGQAHSSATQSTDPGYILHPNDFIQIVVYQEDDLTTTTRLSANGSVVLPLIGSVQVGGVSVADATTLIQDKLKDGYLKDPKVTITMVEFAKKHFTVLGQVQKPGDYDMPQQEEVSILSAIAQAGGYTDTADARAVSVRRNTEGKEQIFTIDAKEMAKQSTHKPFNLEPGDVVTVNEASKQLFSVLGQVQKPGSFSMQEETPVSILNAIAQAGGFTLTANDREVQVQRNTEGKEEIFTIDARQMAKEPTHKPFNLEPGDVVTVVEASKRFFSVLGQVQKPGSYEMQEETQVSLLDAIAQAGGYTNIANPAKVNVRRKGAGAEQVFTLNAKEMAKDSSRQPFYVAPGDVITVSETIF